MRSAAELAVRRWWAGEGGAAGVLLSAAARPAELLFRAAVSARAAGYRSGLLPSARAAIPVISVGNLTVGGTGKTPLVRWIVDVCAASGRRPAVLLRGYGTDEARLHRRWHPGVPVLADPDRVRAARRAAAAGADVLVLDDGFQHRRIARDLDLVVVSAEQPFPGALLPRGPYREPVGALTRADWVVITRRTASADDAARRAEQVAQVAPAARIARARLVPAGWTDLAGAPAPAPGGAALAVSGVGEPASFGALVARATGSQVERLDFPDHHAYSPADVARIRSTAGSRPVVTTEKDAVKLADWAAALCGARVLALRVELEAGEADLTRTLRAVAADDHEDDLGTR